MLKILRTRILFHIILLALLIIGASYSFVKGNELLGAIAIFFSIITIFNLFKLVNKTNQELADFLMNIKYEDFSATYSMSHKTLDEKALRQSFNIITDKFRSIRREKEKQYQYLQAIIEHVDTGLICFDENGKTIMMNQALKGLIHKSYLPTIKSIQKVDEPLYDAIASVTPGDNKVFKLSIDNEILQLAIRKTIIKSADAELHLYALHNIFPELEAQEMISWQKLIRTLTHEIMNSVTPVISLAETTDQILTSSDQMDHETKEDVQIAIQTIQKRSESLLHFTDTYRKLTKIPAPELQFTNLKALIDRLTILFNPLLDQKHIELIKEYPKDIRQIQVDPNLLEQVLINIMKNAFEAVDGHPEAKVVVVINQNNDGTTSIEIADNGPGIPPEVLEKIFIPFYTTKSSGSGIGLSLSRQIIHLHKGSLKVRSQVGEGTVFIITL